MAAEPARPEPVLRNGRGHNNERPAYHKTNKQKQQKQSAGESLLLGPQETRNMAGDGSINENRGPPLIRGGYVPRPPVVPETVDSTEHYIDHVFSYTYVPVIKLNL